MPISAYPRLRLPDPDRRAYLDFMPGSDIPVIRQPFESGDLLPYWSLNPKIDDHYFFDLNLDPKEDENRIGEKTEDQMVEMLRVALREVSARQEQFDRLGIQ